VLPPAAGVAADAALAIDGHAELALALAIDETRFSDRKLRCETATIRIRVAEGVDRTLLIVFTGQIAMPHGAGETVTTVAGRVACGETIGLTGEIDTLGVVGAVVLTGTAAESAWEIREADQGTGTVAVASA